jgi:hypothetical protein
MLRPPNHPIFKLIHLLFGVEYPGFLSQCQDNCLNILTIAAGQENGCESRFMDPNSLVDRGFSPDAYGCSKIIAVMLLVRDGVRTLEIPNRG